MRSKQRKLEEEVEEREEGQESEKEISGLTMIVVAAHKHKGNPPP